MKVIKVTSAQVSAAKRIVERSTRTGESVSTAVRKMAEAKPKPHRVEPTVTAPVGRGRRPYFRPQHFAGVQAQNSDAWQNSEQMPETQEAILSRLALELEYIAQQNALISKLQFEEDRGASTPKSDGESYWMVRRLAELSRQGLGTFADIATLEKLEKSLSSKLRSARQSSHADEQEPSEPLSQPVQEPKSDTANLDH